MPCIHEGGEAAFFPSCGDGSFFELLAVFSGDFIISKAMVAVEHLLDVAKEVPSHGDMEMKQAYWSWAVFPVAHALASSRSFSKVSKVFSIRQRQK